jgi:alcohol dehydrogenase class IV
MRFEFATADRIIFGPGSLNEIGKLVSSLGQRPLVVIGGVVDRAAPLLERLNKSDLPLFSVEKEPSLVTIQQGVALARESHCDLVIGFGGGSALDTGKAIAAMLTNEGDLLDYLEVIGRGQALSKPSAPYIAIPTTAGTGAEVTRNAVLYSPEHHVKVSLRSPHILPDIALVDPELTYSLPPDVTASTGLDALTQLIEPFVSIKANPMTGALCREGMKRAARSLRHAYQDGSSAEAREDMALASLFSGLALANAGLGAVHGFAGPFGGMFDAPHGAVCAALLPHVMAANVRLLHAAQSPLLWRYDEVAQILTGNSHTTADEGVAWIANLVRDLQVPPLRTYGFTEAHVPELIEKSAAASSMKGNPIPLTRDEMRGILLNAL